jgi:hypothetical protein
MELSPADVRGQGDPGDETANRYAYQWSYTAILACGLFDGDGEIVEIYCEHHDDILVKRGDSKFQAVQVKTRQLGSELWKAGDSEVIKALTKFAQLERDLGQHFWRYTLATNHQFFEVRDNGSNLPYLLRLAQNVPDGNGHTLPSHLTAYLNKLAKASGCDQSALLAMLKKADCDHRLPKLNGIRKELCESNCRCHSRGADASYAALQVAADGMTAEIQRAASLQHAQSVPLYLSLRADGMQEEERLLIEGKRLTRARIDTVLQEALASPELLSPADSSTPHPPVPGESRLKLKMNGGGLSAMTVDAARDCYSAAFRQQREWAAKYGEQKALDRYHHLTTVVRAEAAQAYEDTTRDDKPFGREMLKVLRERLQRRRSDGTTALFNCTDEHLLGYSYMLTDECKVWWSRPFRLPEDG